MRRRQRLSYEQEPIRYMEAPANDAVTQLMEQISQGDVELSFDEEHGFLPSLLESLDVPWESQVLVFSKSSLQIRRISPRRPRAIYFNDDVYVGWCQNGDVIEIATTDPNLGSVFYSLKQSEETTPEFIRDRGQCLTCHSSSRTQDVPGFLVRSSFVNAAGHGVSGSRTFTTNQSSPFRQRWGGWYVSGDAWRNATYGEHHLPDERRGV